MSAGNSAAQQAQRLNAVALAHQVESQRAADEAGRFAAAAIAERRLATRLSPLNAHGYHLLADRQWPGSKNAQLDLIVVGPSGLWIIDSKHWNDFSIAAGHLFRGQADVTDEVMRLADVANTAEEAFVELGLAPGEIRVVLAMHERRGKLGEIGPIEVVGADDIHKHLGARGRRLTTSQVEAVLAVAMKYFPAYAGAQQEQAAIVLPEPVLDELPDNVLDDGALLSEDEVRETLTEAELAAPIEDWMTFLHPEQAALVRRTFNGPARIRGSAGTGKTVVGLHRAAYLARVHPQGKILVTTFVKTLPAVMSSLLARMAPEVAGRVEFVSVHALAGQIARDRSVKLSINGRRANDLLKLAWAQLGPDHKARLLPKGGFEYWKEEVDSVIKGRGLTAFEQYADCKRIGRLTRLTVDDRRAVWALYQAYETSMRAEGIHDFNDVVLLAEAAFRKAPRSSTKPSSSMRRKTSRSQWCACCTASSATTQMPSPSSAMASRASTPAATCSARQASRSRAAASCSTATIATPSRCRSSPRSSSPRAPSSTWMTSRPPPSCPGRAAGRFGTARHPW